MITQKLHDEAVSRLQQLVKENYSVQNEICLNKRSLNSNTTRSSDYKRHAAKKLEVDSLNRVLSIDPKRKIVLAEPRVSMLELATYTLKFGLIPKVVPEFKGITVGGAIMGCGGESSSFKHGLFHDICPKLKVMLGDGSIVWASNKENEDLYHGLCGSYGSLGVLLAAEIELEEAKDYVNIDIRRYSSAKEAIVAMREAIHASSDFLEGIVFAKDHAVVLTARQSNTRTSDCYRDTFYAPWYYQKIKHKDVQAISMPILDYIFRYDKGAFWMGTYVLQPGIFKRFLLEGVLKLQKAKLPWLTKPLLEKFCQMNDPGIIVRSLFSWAMTSQRLYNLLHKGEKWVQDRLIVQDFTLPEDSVQEFVDEVEEGYAIYPLWLCPLKGHKSGQLFVPNIAQDPKFTINVGVYGLPDTQDPASGVLSKLEKRAFELSGRKWLYANSCYTLDDFWKIYPEAHYHMLRKNYKADGIWISIENKVLNK